MNPFLIPLLGQQAAIEADPRGLNYDDQGQLNEIVTTGVRRLAAQEDSPVLSEEPRSAPNIQPGYYDNMLLGNNEAIMRRDQAAAEAARVAAPRKGAFGVKGTLRDILGLVGDAFLVQSGNQPLYSQRRQEELLSDAMAGMTAGPAARRAAIERVARVNPTMAEQLLKQYDTDQYRQTVAESQAQRRTAMNENDRARRAARARPNIAAILNTPSAIQNGKVAPWAMNAIRGIVTGEEIDLADAEFFEDMTEEELRNYAKGAGMNVRQQEQTRQGDEAQTVRERNAATAEKNAQSNRIRANRPLQGRQPRAETADERFIRIANTPATRRSSGDQEWYEGEQKIRAKQGQPSQGRGGRPPIPGAAVPATAPQSSTQGRRFGPPRQ